MMELSVPQLFKYNILKYKSTEIRSLTKQRTQWLVCSSFIVPNHCNGMSALFYRGLSTLNNYYTSCKKTVS